MNRNVGTYRSWSEMKQRCLNPRCKSFRNYGGRGITICDRWLESYKAFLADMGERPHGMSLDRIDNNGNYEPSNCRWATRQQQCRNQRVNIVIDVDGIRATVIEHAERMGLAPAPIYSRIKRGWSGSDAVTVGIRPRPAKITVCLHGKRIGIADLASLAGIDPQTARMRLRRGLTPEQIVALPPQLGKRLSKRIAACEDIDPP